MSNSRGPRDVDGYHSDLEVDLDANDVDLPSDGYFEPRPHPSEVFARNPSVNADADAKSREAAEEQRLRASASHPSPPSRPSSAGSNVSSLLTPSLPRSRSPVAWASEQAPLLDAGPAPPSYSDATAGSNQAGQQSSPVDQPPGPANYGSIEPSASSAHPPVEEPQWPFGNRRSPFGPGFPFGPQGGPFGPGGVFGYRGPLGPNGPFASRGRGQSMRDRPHRGRHDPHNEDPDAMVGWWRARKHRRHRKRKSCCSWRGVCKLALTVAIVLLVIWICHIVITLSGGQNKEGDPSQKLPISDPSDKWPPSRSPPRDPYLQHPSTTSCHFEYHSLVHIEEFQFETMNRPNFSLIEVVEADQQFSGRVSGTVSIVPAEEIRGADMIVFVHMATTKPWAVMDMGISTTDVAMEIKAPQLVHTTQAQTHQPCLDIAVEIRVRESAVVDNFVVNTRNLDIIGGEATSQHEEGEGQDFGLTIRNSSYLDTRAGIIDMPYWSSRETYISSSSGAIKGTYALNDLLKIATRSGSIHVGVDPQDIDKDDPNPARLDIQSNSGSINVKHTNPNHHSRSSTKSLPDRDYKTRIESKSSSIHGDFLLGSEATFTSVSGSMELDVLPYDIGQYNPALHTESRSGRTELRLQSPYNSPLFLASRAAAEEPRAARSKTHYDTGMLSHLTSSHKTTSASLSLTYPEEWSGGVSAQTLSGHILLNGKGLKVGFAGKIPPWKKTLARKGSGISTMTVESVAGSLNVTIGDT